MNASLNKRQIWGAPITLGVVSMVGLIAALLGDGLWDVLSWIALAAPVAASGRSLWHPRSAAAPKRRPGGVHTGGLFVWRDKKTKQSRRPPPGQK